MISIYGILEMKLTQDVVVERGGKNGASFNKIRKNHCSLGGQYEKTDNSYKMDFSCTAG